MLKTVQWNVKFGMNYFFWMHFRFITAIDCALSLAVISTANLQWDLQHSQKLYSVQPKYLQCIALALSINFWEHECMELSFLDVLSLISLNWTQFSWFYSRNPFFLMQSFKKPENCAIGPFKRYDFDDTI